MPDAAPPPPRSRNPLRRLYAWVLSWAESKYAVPALAAISFVESSLFPIPPDVLQIALSVAQPKRSYYYAAVSAVASVLGGVLGWTIGYAAWRLVSGFFFDYVPGFTPENFEKVQALYQENAFWAIFAAAFTPIPYKVFTIAAGVFEVSLGVLILASALGRSGRFFAVASVFYFFGAPAKALLEKHFEWATLVLCGLFVAGFLAIKLLLN